jgi:hypothetical protein
MLLRLLLPLSWLQQRVCASSVTTAAFHATEYNRRRWDYCRSLGTTGDLYGEYRAPNTSLFTSACP